MFHSAVSKFASAASKVAGAASDTVSGTASLAEHEAHKVGGTVADAVSGGGVSLAEHEAYKAGSTVANTVSGAISFSEHEAMKHIRALTGLGSRSAAQQYVVKEFENIKETSPGDVDVDVDVVPGSSDLKNVVLKVSPKNAPDADKNAILVSSGLGAAFAGEWGEGDDSSNVAVMLELARGLSQQAHDFKHSVIFFFNTGEEEGLNGSHSFMTQHPWSATIRIGIDLEGMGIGGKPVFSQASGLKVPVIVLFGEEGLNQLPLKQGVFGAQSMDMKGRPISAQDFFNQGTVQSATDFQVCKEVGGLSGLDFALGEGRTAVYHTKNDKSELLKPGSLQHLGENMLPFLLQAASSSDLPK